MFRNYWREFLSWAQDKFMFWLLGRTIIYNISWEDPRIDRDLLHLKEDDTLLMLTSAGCNVLDMLIESPAHIAATDLNPRQNALLELKLACIRTLSYEEFFEIFARSNYDVFRASYPRVRAQLSDYAREFWDERGDMFRNFHWAGASGRLARIVVTLCYLIGLGGLLDGVRDCATLEDQRAVYKRYERRIKWMCGVFHRTRRLWCPLMGVPSSQVELSDGNVVELALHNLFWNTHIAHDNYFFYGYMFGKWTPECCPRYMKREHFETLRANADRVSIHTCTLKDAASQYDDGHFSVFILLDHMDWMPNELILDEWSVFQRKARRGGRVLWRSFANHQHIGPLKYLDFDEQAVRSSLARLPDRVCFYNSTHFARINDDFLIVPRSAYRPPATLGDDVRVLLANWVSPIKGDTHQQRLESFYKRQAQSYDVFRHRFLHGRTPMLECMPVRRSGVWVDLGGGTASNIEHLKDHVSSFHRIVVVDLCRPLLDVAQQRINANGWGDRVQLVHGDATDAALAGLPEPGTVDVVTMSYSLTMIPNWEDALAQAHRLLRPGGHIAVADFTVTPQHGPVTRRFWPRVFRMDGVNLNTEHIKALRASFAEKHLKVQAGGFPYVPLLRCPYYFFIGEKPSSSSAQPNVVGGAVPSRIRDRAAKKQRA